MDILPIGSTAYCAAHKGKIVAYFHAKDFGKEEVYAVLLLEDYYKAEIPEGGHCYIQHLVVHHANLTNKPDDY